MIKNIIYVIILIILWSIALTAATSVGFLSTFGIIGGPIFLLTGWIIPTIAYLLAIIILR